MLNVRLNNGDTLTRSGLQVKTPLKSYRLTHVSWIVETGKSVTKRLFRALLTQLHPGGIWNPEHVSQGRKDLRRGP